MKEPRIAIAGASHWHVPLYVKGLKQLNATVCGVSERDADVARRVANALQTTPFLEVDELIEQAKPDFVFAFAPHRQMSNLARQLIDANIAFAIEKPAGMDYSEVKALADQAEAKGVFCSIPFVWRYSEAVARLQSQALPDDYVHLAFRFVAGPPERYLQNGSSWMLDAWQAGGGCMTNLGVHFLDLALYLTQSTELKVLAVNYHYRFGYPVEDYAVTLFATPEGATIALETGYAYPMDESHKRENTWTVVTRQGYHTLSEGLLENRFWRGGTEAVALTTDSDDLYTIFVRETLKEWAAGNPPAVDLRQMARVRRILDEINKLGVNLGTVRPGGDKIECVQ